MIDFYPYTSGFKEHLEIVNRSPYTIKIHMHRLEKFISYMMKHELNDVQDIDEEHIREYQKYRHYFSNKNRQQDTIAVQNRHLATVKCFFKYLKVKGFIVHNPTLEVIYAKEPRRLPKTALNDTEMRKLLEQPNVKTAIGYRDRTILEVLYSTAIRRMELINLNIEDIDYLDGYVRINQGKGAKDRVVPIGKVACKFLETYIKGIRPLFYRANETQSLFISKKGNKFSKNAVGEMILKYSQQAGLSKHVTTHTFRRSCATEMIKNNANPMHVKNILGHASMDTVQTYCDLAINDLKEAHAKYHPRERNTL